MLKLFCLAVLKVGKGTPMCFRTVLISKILWILGVPWFSVAMFLSHSTKKVHRGNLLCFRSFFVFFFGWDDYNRFADFFCLTVQKYCVGQNFSVSLIFGYWQKLSIKGGISRFSEKNFLSHCTKNFRRWTLCVSETSWYQIILDIRSMTTFCQFLCSHDTQKFRGGTLKYFTISGYWKLLSILGLYHDFRLNFFVSQYRKDSKRNPSLFQTCSGIKNFLDIRSVTIFFRMFFVSQYRNFRGWTLFFP